MNNIIGTKIIICGLNGAGKSTLGRVLADRTGWVFKDVEDYYFPKNDPSYPYATQRTEEEIVKLLHTDLCQNDNIIFAGVRGNYSSEIAAMFTNAVFIKVPKEIRMERVRSRAFNKFGNRVLQGGDLYERENAFYDIIEKRTDEVVTKWLKTLNIPVITIDGQKPIEENVDLILEILK